MTITNWEPVPPVVSDDFAAPDRKVCSIEGCDRPSYVRGLCHPHYDRARYLEKRETIIAKVHEYYRANQDTILSQHHEYYAANREQIALRHHEYYLANRDWLSLKKREWASANHEKMAAYYHKYKIVNRERISAQHHDYHIANREAVIKRVTEWRKAHPELARKYVRKYLAANPGLRRECEQRRRALELNAPGRFTRTDWQALIARAMHCHWCKRPWKECGKPTHDHVIPLSKGGANSPENSVAACGDCNRRKHASRFHPITGQGILL